MFFTPRNSIPIVIGIEFFWSLYLIILSIFSFSLLLVVYFKWVFWGLKFCYLPHLLTLAYGEFLPCVLHKFGLWFIVGGQLTEELLQLEESYVPPDNVSLCFCLREIRVIVPDLILIFYIMHREQSWIQTHMKASLCSWITRGDLFSFFFFFSLRAH